MSNPLKALTTLGKVALGGALLVILAAIFFWASAQEFWTSHTPVVEAPPSGVTTEFVQQHLPLYISGELSGNTKAIENTTKKVEKEIVKLKETNAKPSLVVPSSDKKAIENKLYNDKADIALKEKKEDGTTNIYSISVKKAKHGVGFYLNYTDRDGDKIKNTSGGVHYRNKRFIYQAGVDLKGRPECRVAYELFQW